MDIWDKVTSRFVSPSILDDLKKAHANGELTDKELDHYTRHFSGLLRRTSHTEDDYREIGALLIEEMTGLDPRDPASLKVLAANVLGTKDE